MARNRQQTESRIRAAALQLLREGGFESWGVNAIARTAGVDKVLIYRYFGSVDKLLGDLIQETTFWPDPDALPDQSPEAFIEATMEALLREIHVPALLGHPSARAPLSDIRRKFTADLDRWLAGLRQRTRGSITDDQLERLPALLHFRVLSGRENLSPRDLWRQVSPPLEWGQRFVQPDEQDLPPELL